MAPLKMIKFICCGFIGACLLLLSCTDSIVDGGTETGNAIGILYNPNGSRAANAKVYIVSVDHNPKPIKRIRAIDSTITDDTGAFVVDSVPEGYYNILGSGDSGISYADSLFIDNDTIPTELTDTLRAPGTLRGVVRLQGDDDSRTVFILVFGTQTWTTPADSIGNFTLASMAEGTYHVRLLTTLDDYGVLDTNLTIIAGTIDTLSDTIFLPFTGIPIPQGLTLAYDTMKQIVTLSWDKADTNLVKGYNVYRKHSDSDFVKINTALVTDTTYSDSSAIQDESYEYKIKAVDMNDEEGEFSEGVSVEVVSAFVLSDTVGTGTLQGYQRIAVDATGKLYIADIFDPDWTLYIYAVDLTLEKTIDSIDAKYPYDLDVDSSGNITLMNQDGIVVLDSGGSVIDTLTDFANNENKQFVLSDSVIFFTSGIIGKYTFATDTLETSPMISADGLVLVGNRLYVGGQTNTIRLYDLDLNADSEWTLAFDNDELPRLLETDAQGHIYVFGYHFNPHSFSILVYGTNQELLSQLSLPSNANGLEVFGTRLFVATDAGILVYE